MTREDALLDRIKNIEVAIDLDAAMEVCADSVELYEEILQILIDECVEKTENVRNYLQNADYKNYIILVHGMKNECYNIGAMALGDDFKSLEFAGKEERYDALEQDTDRIVKAYEDMVTEIANLMEDLPEE